jgi:hypothetical protein
MKQLNEIKRLQQLAGIQEIKINNPSPIKNGDKVKILVNVYYDGYQAIPEYELDDMIDEFELYIKKDTIGTYYEDKDGDGEFIDEEGNDTRIEKKYLKRIE